MKVSAKLFQWHYATRTFGAVFATYGLLFDKSPDRGTIILAGLGLLGFDKVAKAGGANADKPKPPTPPGE